MDVKFGGVVVQGSPFYIKAYDASRVAIQGIQDGIVGQSSCFIGKLIVFHLSLSCSFVSALFQT